MKDLIKTNIYIEKSLYNFLKIYCKDNDLRLNKELPKIINDGWETYKQKNNIKI